ncbi:tetratricopeptide repeat protein [bacterium]|nr:tetratricopeptide repeat protein [bacterium]
MAIRKWSAPVFMGLVVSLAGCSARQELDDGDVFLSQGKPQEALAVWRHALAAEPRDTSLLIRIATAQTRTGDLAGAEQTMLSAADIEPDSPKVAQNLALVYLKQKDLDRALGAFQRAVAIEDTYPLANYYIGLIHEMRGDAETAARYYTRDVNSSMSPAMLRLLAYKERQRELGVIPPGPSSGQILTLCMALLLAAAGAYGLRLVLDRKGRAPAARHGE